MTRLEAFIDELEKIAVTRSVKEWRRAQGAGDINTANQIAQGAGQLGLKPRYLHDVSLGGAEAGVDRMMGRMQGPSGDVNESGYIARKMYKPDSDIHRAEFTPQVLQQKQEFTDAARAISPEAKAMVPAMYGHKTMGAGPTQRSMSYHEYVPNMADIRGTNTGTEEQKIWSRPLHERSRDIESVRSQVLNPLRAQGKHMADVVSEEGGVNYGNIANTPQGPKVVDFLPNQSSGGPNPMMQSFQKYAPTGTQFAEGGAQPSVGALRKEVFKPKMQIQEATPEMQAVARRRMGLEPPPAPHATTVVPGAEMRTGAASPQARRSPVPAAEMPTSRAIPMPAARPAAAAAPAAATMGTHAGWFKQAPKAMPRVMPPAPGMMTRAGSFARGLIGRAR